MGEKLTCISIDMLMVVSYVIIGLLFIKSKGKGCNFIAGYNMKTPEERKNYDEVKICKYYGKTILIWAVFFIVGALVDFFAPGVGIGLAFLLLAVALIYHIIYTIRRFHQEFEK